MTNDSVVLHVTSEDFESKVLKADKLVLIDFWAEWCPPCKAIAPVLEEVAKEKQDVLLIAKVNVEEDPELAEKFAVSSIPKLVFLKGGKVVDDFVGSVSKKTLLEKVQTALTK